MFGGISGDAKWLMPSAFKAACVWCTSVVKVRAHVCVCVCVCMGGFWQTSPTLAGGKSMILRFPGEGCSEHQPSAITCCSVASVSVGVCAIAQLRPKANSFVRGIS